MLGTIVKKEILDHMLSFRFAITCVLCFVIIISVTVVMTKEYSEGLKDYHTNVVMHRNEVSKFKHPWEMMWRGVKVDKPPNAMKIFFKGTEKKINVTANVTAYKEPEYEASYERNPIRGLFISMDLIFFVGVIMSLVAIFFSYDAVSGEKEKGTLKLALSYSVPRDIFLLGKWLGGYISLILPFVISIICGLLITIMYPQVNFSASNWLGIGIILFVSLLYIACIYSLGVFISARTQKSATAITILVLIWIVGILIIPNVSPYIAQQIYGLPSVQSIEKEKQNISIELQKKTREEYEK